MDGTPGQYQDENDAWSRLSSIDGPRTTQLATCSRQVKPRERIKLVSPKGEACELRAYKDGKGRIYIVVRSDAERPFRLTPETPAVS